jgi:rubrerythrin
MTVSYPRKYRNTLSARDILKRVVEDRELHMMTLNRYRYNEQRSCKDLTELIERLNGQPKELIRDLSNHIAEESRHALWLTDLLIDLGADVGMPTGISYIDAFEKLIDQEAYGNDAEKDNIIIAGIAAINATEKRGCEFFSAHIEALKEAPQTEENIKIRETIERIFPEEAGHVRWGNRWLAKIAQKSSEYREKVEVAKRRYFAIEQAAYESNDIMMGAEFRRIEHLMAISETMPLLERTQYLMKHIPEMLFDPQLQSFRIEMAQKAWQKDPKIFVEKFLPMFFNGINKSDVERTKEKNGSHQ